MAIQGILVDVDYCTGCEACVLACQQEHGYSEKEFGIKITKLGPLHIDEANKVFQYDFIPQFTQWCDLCEERCGKGNPRAFSTARHNASTGARLRSWPPRSTRPSR